jgi:hypothetical protein
MPKLLFRGSAFLVLGKFLGVSCFAAAWLVVGCVAQVQTYPSLKEVRVSGLPSLMARSHNPSDVLLTSLDTVIHDRGLCCGKDSALVDSAEKADASSLKDVAEKLQGRQLLGDGRPIRVTARFTELADINSGLLITTLREKHAMLFEWNLNLYVCYGVSYRRDFDYTSGTETDTVQKFLLLDTRYSDSRRQTVFDRATDDASKVQGMLWVAVAPQ